MSVKLYGLDADFERLAVYFLATDRDFWDVLGEHVDPEAFTEGPPRQLIEACKGVAATKLGRRPGGPMVIGQHLVSVGKLRLEEIQSLKDWLQVGAELAEKTKSDPEAVREILADTVRRHAEMEAIKEVTHKFVKKEELSTKGLEKAASIGRITSVQSEGMGVEAFQSLAAEEPEHLETGIPELDEKIRGLPIGTIGLWIGDTGGGKSMALSQVAANAWLWGLRVCYATLELPAAPTKLRILGAALRERTSDIRTAAIEDDKHYIKRIDEIAHSGGHLEVAYFPPSVTTPSTLFQWVESIENRHKFKNDLLVIDYADRLGVEGTKLRRGDGDYHTSRIIYESFQEFTKTKDTRIWTASQTRRGASKKDKAQARSTGRLVDLQDVADSKHKVNAADLVITITPNETYDELGDLESDMEKQLTLLVAKYRYGSGRVKIGPLPAGFGSGRLIDTGTSRPWRIGRGF